MKLNKPYDNDKVKRLVSKHMKKPFKDVTEEEFLNVCLLWYAMAIEFIDTDIDMNMQTMMLQMTIKENFWEK